MNSSSFSFLSSILFISVSGVTFYFLNSSLIRKSKEKRKRSCHPNDLSAYNQLIGNTPLIKLHRLSQLCGKNIFLKVGTYPFLFLFYMCLLFSQLESSNPGGTGKDRAVKHMLDSAEETGLLTPGMNVIEGTSGSTGICLAYQCKLRGYILHIVMPDDQAEEKRLLLEKLGAIVHIVPAAAIANKNHYVNKAAQLTKDLKGFFVNQFENVSNYLTHYHNTGPEIYSQMNGKVDGFIMSSGTGGTIAGISR
jgi:cysteine synthase A